MFNNTNPIEDFIIFSYISLCVVGYRSIFVFKKIYISIISIFTIVQILNYETFSGLLTSYWYLLLNFTFLWMVTVGLALKIKSIDNFLEKMKQSYFEKYPEKDLDKKYK